MMKINCINWSSVLLFVKR